MGRRRSTRKTPLGTCRYSGRKTTFKQLNEKTLFRINRIESFHLAHRLHSPSFSLETLSIFLKKRRRMLENGGKYAIIKSIQGEI